MEEDQAKITKLSALVSTNWAQSTHPVSHVKSKWVRLACLRPYSLYFATKKKGARNSSANSKIVSINRHKLGIIYSGNIRFQILNGKGWGHWPEYVIFSACISSVGKYNQHHSTKHSRLLLIVQIQWHPFWRVKISLFSSIFFLASVHLGRPRGLKISEFY